MVAEREHRPGMRMKKEKINKKIKIHTNTYVHGSWERAPLWYAYEKIKKKIKIRVHKKKKAWWRRGWKRTPP